MRLPHNLLLAAALLTGFGGSGKASPPDPRPAETSGSPEVLLARIRVSMDDALYEWTPSALQPMETASAGIGGALSGDQKAPALTPGTVLSFIDLKPGRRYRPDDLERRCREGEARLLDSALTYGARVTVLPPRRDPESRTVLVTVKSGFLWRFGGGNAYGTVGKAAVGGERLSVRLFAGWNRNGAEILHQRAGGLPLVLGAGAFFDAPGLWPLPLGVTGLPPQTRVFEASLTQGVYAGPDLFLGVDEGAAFSLGAEGSPILSVQPRYRFERFLVSRNPGDAPVRAGSEGRLWWFPGREDSAKAEVSAWVRLPLSERLAAAAKGAAGASVGEFGFDLFGAEDRSVRSGYAFDGLQARRFGYASAEGRFLVADLPLGGGISCRIEAFAFADAAVLERFRGGSTGLRDAEAFGSGLRFLFDSPVFAYFSLSGGVNPRLEPRFCLTGTAGY